MSGILHVLRSLAHQKPWLPAVAAWSAALPVLALLAQDPAAAPPEDAHVRSLEIVDSQGRARLRLGLDERGGPELRMSDEQGRTRLRAAIHGNSEPIVILHDDEGRQRISLVVDKTGNPFVLLARRGGKPAAQLAVSTLGAPSLVFTHEDGATNAGIGQHADGRGWTLPISER